MLKRRPNQIVTPQVISCTGRPTNGAPSRQVIAAIAETMETGIASAIETIV